MNREVVNQKYLPRMKEIAAIAETRGEEEAHIKADRLLVALLKELEFGEIATVFDDMPKWYS